ncbi:uncharacterized protein At4g04775-like [Eutrema salsugineum]|uniref:uncharacterized protein At4g04775-like n=1 Tax=Eutrema salsugineum TaxID=72664 RepID=UPI000CED2F8A|nr:uncharacterized protein At4g04775-like [Eutrema salsugineum]
MPISYSESSSEAPEEDLGWAYADADWGIREKCFCGRLMKIETASGLASGNGGRKYYKCPVWVKEGRGEHICKWWDEGVTEEIGILQGKVADQKERLATLDRQVAFDPRIRELRDEVALLKDEIVMLLDEIAMMKEENAMMKEEIAKAGDGALTLCVLAVFAAISYLFK